MLSCATLQLINLSIHNKVRATVHKFLNFLEKECWFLYSSSSLKTLHGEFSLFRLSVEFWDFLCLRSSKEYIERLSINTRHLVVDLQ